jgi:choline dehydrogenase-like flavoprotein
VPGGRLIALQDAERRDCSVLIVGAGMSGLSVALELAAVGVEDVIVTEGGTFSGFEHESVSQSAGKPILPIARWTSQSRDYQSPPGLPSTVGGRSRCWHGVVLPVKDSVLDAAWPRATAERLKGDRAGSYARVMRDLGEWKGVSLESAACESDITLSRALNGYPSLPDFSPVPQASTSTCLGGPRLWFVYSPLLSWRHRGLARFEELRLPDIYTDAQALSLDLDGTRVVGARFAMSDGRIAAIHASVVVLAAGTLETTRLYAQALAHTGEVITSWPGLNDHIVHGYVQRAPEDLIQAWTAGERAFLMADRSDDFNANLFVELHADALDWPVLDVWWMAQQEEPFEGSVSFKSSGSPWRGTIDGRPSQADALATLAREEEALRILGIVAGDYHSVNKRPVLFVEALGLTQVSLGACRYRNPLGSSDHESGTLPLGTRLSPVGCSSWSPSLYVTGPATFPNMGAANPTLSILATAEHTAREIASRNVTA